MASENPFIKYPDAIESRKKIKAILFDYFLDKKVNANVLVAAYDSGIVNAIQNSNTIDNMFVMRYEKILISEYAIQPEMAKWSVLYWVEMYGVQLLKKNISITNNTIYEEIKDNSKNVSSYISEPRQLSLIFGKKVKDMIDKEKIPQTAIDIKDDLFKKLGINKFTCVIRKDKSHDYTTTLKCYTERAVDKHPKIW